MPMLGYAFLVQRRDREVALAPQDGERGVALDRFHRAHAAGTAFLVESCHGGAALAPKDGKKSVACYRARCALAGRYAWWSAAIWAGIVPPARRLMSLVLLMEGAVPTAQNVIVLMLVNGDPSDGYEMATLVLYEARLAAERGVALHRTASFCTKRRSKRRAFEAFCGVN